MHGYAVMIYSPKGLMISTTLRAVIICQTCGLDKKSRIKMIRLFWWGEVDSNHRSRGRQIYSLFPLAARESPHNKMELVIGIEPTTY